MKFVSNTHSNEVNFGISSEEKFEKFSFIKRKLQFHVDIVCDAVVAYLKYLA